MSSAEVLSEDNVWLVELYDLDPSEYGVEFETPEVETGEGSRLAKWEVEMAELTAMLGVEHLPDQTIRAKEWESLSERIKSGDAAAKTELLTRNVRTTYGAAKHFCLKMDSPELTVEDVFQEAMVKVWRAVDNYTGQGKTTLKELIQYGVRNGLKRAAYRRGLIRVPASTYQNLLNIEEARARIARQLGRDVSGYAGLELVADALGRDVSDLETETRNYDERDYNQMTTIDEDSSQFGEDETAHTQALELWMDISEINRILPHLDSRQRSLIERIYGLNGSTPTPRIQLAAEYNITNTRVSQIEEEALKKIRVLYYRNRLARDLSGEQHQPTIGRRDGSHKQTILHRVGAGVISDQIIDEHGAYIGNLAYFVMRIAQSVVTRAGSADVVFDQEYMAQEIEHRYLKDRPPIPPNHIKQAIREIRTHGIIEYDGMPSYGQLRLVTASN